MGSGSESADVMLNVFLCFLKTNNRKSILFLYLYFYFIGNVVLFLKNRFNKLL